MTRTPALDPAAALAAELAEVGVEAFTSSEHRPGVVVHLVLMRFADGVTGDQRDAVLEAVRDLADCERDGRRYVLSVDAGGQTSGETGVNDWDLGFAMRFASQGDRNFYVGEPVVTDPEHYDARHAAFKRMVGPLLRAADGVAVLDLVS